MDFLQNINPGSILIQLAVLLFSLSIHEASHAWMADRLGDYTARYLGRVTLNPIAHIDPIGTLLFPLLQFFTGLPLIGWAKPVPVNPAHLRNPQRDQMFVSLAGPGSNLLSAGAAFVLLVLLKLTVPQANGLIINTAVTMNIPLQQSTLAPIVGLLFFALVINLALAVFNLLPIPPLDGHWIVYGLLPYNAARAFGRLGSYGILILYGLMFLGAFRLLFTPIWWVIDALLRF
ncbi:MAG: site-2 protease family protein [Acidobacteriota bacterium]